jgi:hypothetical protein
MILYLLIILIFIFFLFSYYNVIEYFTTKNVHHKKDVHNNISKTVTSIKDIINKLKKSKAKTPSFRTCYPTGSSDVEKCFNDLPQKSFDGVYITSSHVGSKFCPWDNGGDPDYWKKMKEQKNKTGKEVWGIINRADGDPLPKWEDVMKCMCLDGNCNDDRNGLFSGLLIDIEGKDMDKNKCNAVKDLSKLNIPTVSVVGNHTCSNYDNPKGHQYISMCYDGEKCEKDKTCLKNIKGVKISKYMYSTNEWPSQTLCTPYDVYHPNV